MLIRHGSNNATNFRSCQGKRFLITVSQFLQDRRGVQVHSQGLNFIIGATAMRQVPQGCLQSRFWAIAPQFWNIVVYYGPTVLGVMLLVMVGFLNEDMLRHPKSCSAASESLKQQLSDPRFLSGSEENTERVS
jgi:hypothetical protein